ncbi:MAG: Ig-like domain-containing protein [Aliishimia sp.]
MANLGNSDREVVAGITEIGGGSFNPTTVGDDTITLSGSFLLAGTTAGLINGLSQTTVDTLILSSSNLRNVDIEDIEVTQLTGTSTHTIDADQWGDLGQVTASPSSGGFSNARLSNAAGQSVSFANTTVADGIIFRVDTTDVIVGDTFSADFSSTTFGLDASLDYNGSVANETVTGGSSADDINISSGSGSVMGGAGDDVIAASSGNVTLRGGLGNDTINGSQVSGLIEGNAGADELDINGAFLQSGVRQPVQILGGTGEDLLDISGNFGDGNLFNAGADDDVLLFVGATTGVATIDGGAGTDALEVAQANFSGTTFQGIESTEILNNSFLIIDADQLNNLGPVTITNVFSNTTSIDANLTFNFANVALGTPLAQAFGTSSALGANERLAVGVQNQQTGDEFSIDFSNISMEADSFLQYTGSLADETVVGTSGNDSVNIGFGMGSVSGGLGDDSLRASSGYVTLEGGAGNDTITGSSVSGLLDGGSGDDIISQNVAFTDVTRQPVTILGGTGLDTISVISIQGDGSEINAGADDDILDLQLATLLDGTVDGGSGTDQLNLRSTNLTGTQFSNIENTLLTGSGVVRVDADQLANLGKFEITNINGGSSTVFDGNLTLSFANLTSPIATTFGAMSGLDDDHRLSITTTGQSNLQDVTLDFSGLTRGADSLLRYTGSAANETVTGSDGDDTIAVSTGTNSATGGLGNDILSAGTGLSTLLGGQGDDTISGSVTSGLLDGGEGNDTITQTVAFNSPSGREPITILGGTGLDTITIASIQGEGSLIDAGADDDVINTNSLSLLNSTLDGGSGTDKLFLSSATLTGTEILGIENSEFSNASTVTITADQLQNLGVVEINDVIVASNANDANLQLNFTAFTAPETVTTTFTALSALDAGERLNIFTSGQTVGLNAVLDFSTLDRTDDDSLLTYTGSLANETITGTTGDDILNASAGTNSVLGGVGNDSLSAGTGFSTLQGGAGDDTITGSQTSGLFEGGSGDDVFSIGLGFFDNTVSERAPVTILGGTGLDDITVSSVHGDGGEVRGGADDDTISLNSAFFQEGIIDGGNGTNHLNLSASNLIGTDISNIATTELTNASTNTVDADEIDDLGVIEITDINSNANFDGRLTLNYAGLATDTTIESHFAEMMRLDAGERLSVNVVGQTSDHDADIDLSSIARDASDTQLVFSGGAGNETVTGTSGDDAIGVNAGTNFVDAGDGNDGVSASTGFSTLLGGLGDDTLTGTGGTSGLFDGGEGNDTITKSFSFAGTSGIRQPTTILGGTGNDVITTTSTQGDGTLIDAGDDDDIIALSFGGLQNSTVAGGAGLDALNLTSTLLTGTEFSGIESTLITSVSTNTIDSAQIGNLGVLRITDVNSTNNTQADANLSLTNGAGQTADFGGLILEDNQRLSVTRIADVGVAVTDFSGAVGTATSVIAFRGSSSLDNSDYVIGSDLTDMLVGGTFSGDTISYEGSDAGVNIDLATQTVSGGFADGDTISSFENATGSEFDDNLTGSTSGNVLTGLGGDDTYVSGLGADTVVVTQDNGDDVWSDFVSGGGNNRVDLRSLPKDVAIIAFLTATEVNGDTVLDFATGGSITLQGEALASFDISDVILEDGVYAIDESFSGNEDTVITGNILTANAPFNFADLEVINQMLAAAGGLEVQDFTVNGTTIAAGETLSFASGATLSVEANGDFSYDPTSGAGTQALSELLGEQLAQDWSYTAISTVTGEVDQGDVSLTIDARNDVPVIAGAVVASATEDDTVINIDLLGQSSDVDNGDVLSVINLDPLPAGFAQSGNFVSFDATNAAYQPLNQDEVTTITLNYDVQDLFGAVTTGGATTLTLTGINDAPTLAAGLMTATEDGSAQTLNLATLGDDADSENNGANLDYAIVTNASEGEASIAGTILSFDPLDDFQDLAINQTRDVTIQVQAKDDRDATATNTVTVTVTGVNDDPTLGAASMAATEDGAAVTLELSDLGNDVDSDDDGDSLTYTVDTDPAEGTASINGTVLTFTPGAAFQDLPVNGTRDVTITVQAEDRNGGKVTNDITVTVTGVNDDPTLGAASMTATEDGAAVTLELSDLGNDVDSDDDGDSLTYTVDTDPAEGTASINGTVLTFTPGAAFQDLPINGTRDVTITVQAEDSNGGKVTNDITVTVTGVNDDPTLQSAILAAGEDGPAVSLDLSVLGDDADNDDDGDSLTYSIDSQTAGGTASITGVNNTDLEFDANGDFEDLAVGETRDVIITLTAEDRNGGTSQQAEVTVTVTGANDRPTMIDGALATTEDGDAVTLNLATLGDDVDSDDDGDSLTYSITQQPSEGTASVNGTELTFTPGAAFQNLAAGESRQVVINVMADDGNGGMAISSVTVTVDGVNEAPTLDAGQLNAFEDGSAATLDLSTLGNDIDSDDTAASLTYTVASQPSEGSASVSGNILTFTPGSAFQDLAAGQTRDVTISVQAEDGNTATATNDVVVTVTGTNDLPEITNIDLFVTIDENQASVATITATDADTIDDLEFSIAGGADAALFQIDQTTGALSFVAAPDFETPGDAGGDNVYDVDVAVSDGTVSDTRSVEVTVADVLENAVATVSLGVQPTSADEGNVGTSAVEFTVTRTGSTAAAVTATLALAGSAAASDFTGAIPATITLDIGESSASFTLDIIGDLTPELDETIEVTITSLDRADHAIGVTGATHTILNDDNTSPVANEDGPFAIDEDAGGTTGNVLSNDTDVDLDNLAVTGFDGLTALGASVTYDGNGIFSIDANGAYEALNANQIAADSFDYTIADGLATSSATVALNVTGQNDTPTVAAGALAVIEDGGPETLNLNTLGDDADAQDNGASLTYALVAPVQGVSLTGSELTFDPGADFQALGAGETTDVTVQVTATDSQKTTSEAATVTVTITGVDDAPVFQTGTAFSVDENVTAIGTVAATDIDASGAIGYSVVGGADAALFDIDASTGELLFITAQDFEAPGDIGGDGDYDVIVRADGGGGSTTDQAIVVSLNDVDDTGPVLNDIVGTNGIDRLFGTEGADRIDPMGGAIDILFGNGGADVFDFTSSSNNGERERKFIYDFDAAEGDLLNFGTADVVLAAGTNDVTYINLNEDGDQIVLIGVSTFDNEFLV